MPDASITKLVAVMGCVCVIVPVPVKVTIVPLMGALIVILLGSIFSAPPALITLLIVILLAANVVKLTPPVDVSPITELAVPTTKSVLLVSVSVPTPAPEIVPNVLLTLLSVKFPSLSVSPYPAALKAPEMVVVPTPPMTASAVKLTPPK